MTALPSNRRLLVEGWRFIAHSFAQVNQFQLLELMRCNMGALAHRDLPFLLPYWKPCDGLFPPEDEARLRQIPAPQPGEKFDTVYRIAAPYDFRFSPDAARTVVFCPNEFKVIPKHIVAGFPSFAQAMAESTCTIVTPSNWSRQGLIESGADPKRVFVVPHGVDTNLFHPASADQRADLRQRLRNSSFTFLNIGTLTGNKGVMVLLKAFAAVLQKHPDTWLLLKGMDALYRSQDMLNEQCKLLTPEETRRIVPRIKYIGHNLTANDLAGLYQSTDAYVTPYFAEGFNLPALEALACGLPLICTAGGPTDDFVNDDLALRISSKPIAVPSGVNVGGTALEPNLQHLIELMNRVIEDPSITQRARSRGPEHVAANFTWRHAVLRLMDILFAE